MFRIVLLTLLCLYLAGSPPARAGNASEDTPSAAMLEFLAEFEDMDDETFELLVEHGVRDARKHRRQSRQQDQPNTDEEASHGEDE
ncbi:MAG: hypothetical protein R3296_00780 [Oleiphilaceae bacterium]|nr:hypothetical protein [Oleiphilaceae bacterium]